MGAITIKIPQKVNRLFHIDDRKSADEILADLERRSMPLPKTDPLESDRLAGIRKLARKYRKNPSKVTLAAIELAESWRKKWDR